MINCKIATKLAIVKTEHVIRNTLFIHLWLCAICNCISCHCLIHDVMLCSQNQKLNTACARGKVAEVKRLLSLGATPQEEAICPVWTSLECLHLMNHFSHRNKVHLSHCSCWLQRTLHKLLDHMTRHNTHSLWMGGATSAAEADGCIRHTIKRLWH